MGCGLMMYHGRSTSYSKYTVPSGDIDIVGGGGGTVLVLGMGTAWEISLSSGQFFCELQRALSFS